jgi:GntR family transcriptional regulator
MKSTMQASEPVTTLVRDSHISLRRQVAQQLRGEIENGSTPVGHRLPAEHALAARFGVSRITVQHAIGDLVSEGLLLRKQGKGTFVSRPTVKFNLQSFHGFFDAVLEDSRSEARLLFLGPSDSMTDEVNAAEINSQEFPVLLRRLYLAETEPIALVDCWLVGEAQRILREDAELRSSAWLLKERLGLQITRSTISVRADQAGRRLGKHLKLSSRAPILTLTRTSYDRRGRRLELARFFLNSANYQLTLASDHPIPISSAIKPTVASC